MSIIVFVLAIVSAFMMWRLISFGVRSANSISRSSEASAAALQAIYDAMPPEAQQRAFEARERRVEQVRAARREWAAIIGVVLLVFSVGFLLVMMVPTP
jgi:CHASE3 domain sensor protein